VDTVTRLLGTRCGHCWRRVDPPIHSGAMPEVDVYCIPPEDLDFERRVRHLAHLYMNATIAQVEAVLRQEYPNARMAVRANPGGVIGLNDRVSWYAYRDGLGE
jgi:hypothetical protein